MCSSLDPSPGPWWSQALKSKTTTTLRASENKISRSIPAAVARSRLPRVIDPVFVQIQDATLATTKLSKIVRQTRPRCLAAGDAILPLRAELSATRHMPVDRGRIQRGVGAGPWPLFLASHPKKLAPAARSSCRAGNSQSYSSWATRQGDISLLISAFFPP